MELMGLCLILGAVDLLLAWAVLVLGRQIDRTNALLAKENRDLADRLMSILNLEASYFKQQHSLAVEQAKAAVARVEALAMQPPGQEPDQPTGEEPFTVNMPSHGGVR